MADLRLSDLSAPRQALVRQCQRLHFGTIRSLEVRDAEPVFGPTTEVLHDVKLSGDGVQRPEQDLLDFVLTAKVRKLLSMLDTIRDGSIEFVEVREGIPQRIVFKAADSLIR